MNMTNALRSARMTLPATTVALVAVAGAVVASNAPAVDAHRSGVTVAAKEWRRTAPAKTTVVPVAKEWRRTTRTTVVVPVAKEWRRTTTARTLSA